MTLFSEMNFLGANSIQTGGADKESTKNVRQLLRRIKEMKFVKVTSGYSNWRAG